MESTQLGGSRPPARGSRLRRVARGLLGAVAYVGVTLLALALTSLLVIPKNNQVEFGMVDPGANGVMGEPSDSIDVLFVGNSLTYSSVSPLRLWKEYGFTSYDCATSGQSLTYGMTLLKRALKSQHPKVVVLEANSIYTYFSKTDALMRTAEDVFPVFEYHDRWKRLGPQDFTSLPQATWRDDLKGFRPNQTADPADTSAYMVPSTVAVVPGKNNLAYLKEMVRMCREAGATPVIVSTPSVKCWTTERYNGMILVAQELGVDFVDMNVGDDKVDIDWNTDTRDKGDHLNSNGAVKVTRSMGSLLKERYGLVDRRGNKVIAQEWDEACKRNGL